MVLTYSICIVSFTPLLSFVVQTVFVLLHISEMLAHKWSIFEYKFIRKIWSHGAHLPITKHCNILFFYILYIIIFNVYSLRATTPRILIQVQVFLRFSLNCKKFEVQYRIIIVGFVLFVSGEFKIEGSWGGYRWIARYGQRWPEKTASAGN